MSSRGRPVATSHAEIERVAFRLFAEHGFDTVTMADIAAEVGVGRRTLNKHLYHSVAASPAPGRRN